jgi:hypothetical protein
MNSVAYHCHAPRSRGTDRETDEWSVRLMRPGPWPGGVGGGGWEKRIHLHTYRYTWLNGPHWHGYGQALRGPAYEAWRPTVSCRVSLGTDTTLPGLRRAVSCHWAEDGRRKEVVRSHRSRRKRGESKAEDRAAAALPPASRRRRAGGGGREAGTASRRRGSAGGGGRRPVRCGAEGAGASPGGGGATGDGLGECDLGFECSFYTRVVHEFLADQDLTCYHHASPLLVSCSCRHYGPNWRPKHWHYRRRVVSCQNCVFPDRASVGPSCSCQLPSIHTEYTRRYMHTLKITIQSPFFYLDRTQRSLYEMPWPSNL